MGRCIYRLSVQIKTWSKTQRSQLNRFQLYPFSTGFQLYPFSTHRKLVVHVLDLWVGVLMVKQPLCQVHLLAAVAKGVGVGNPLNEPALLSEGGHCKAPQVQAPASAPWVLCTTTADWLRAGLVMCVICCLCVVCCLCVILASFYACIVTMYAMLLCACFACVLCHYACTRRCLMLDAGQERVGIYSHSVCTGCRLPDCLPDCELTVWRTCAKSMLSTPAASMSRLSLRRSSLGLAKKACS